MIAAREGRRRWVAARLVAGFVGFGLFWGAWGGALPYVQAQARVSDAQLGGGLLLIGLSALVSMRLSGRLLDRFGSPMVVATVAAFAVTVGLLGLASSPILLAGRPAL